MKKDDVHQKGVCLANTLFVKIWRIMKLTGLLMLISFVAVSASTYSQNARFSFKIENGTLNDLFLYLEQNSEYRFAYNKSDLDDTQKISYEFADESVEQILNKVLDTERLSISVKKDYIIITNKGNILDKPSFRNQPIQISGRVTDSSGSPLPGVTVVVKGTTQGTITDADGNYSLSNVFSDATLVFSFVGMKTQEIPVGGKPIINVKLAEDAIGIEEVVAVGYGSMKKSDLTGSISSVSANEMNAASSTTLDLALQGRASGVQIINTSAEPGGNAKIRIRGSNSVSGDNEPLIVIDGYPISREGEASGTGFGEGLNPLSSVNPNDIESVQILKDASATAIYGSRGANGVILITTKRGKEGKTQVEFESLVGINRVANFPKMGTASQYAQMWNDYNISLGTTPRYDGSSPSLPTPEEAGEGTNWLDEIIRIGVTNKHQMSLRGGNKAVRYNISGNYSDENGVVIGSQMKRGVFRVNLDNDFSNKLSVSTTINISNTAYNRIQTGSGQVTRLSDPVILALRANPVIPADATGTGEYGGTSIGDADGNFFENPKTLITDKRDLITTEDYFGSIKGTYKFTNDISAVVNTGQTRRYSIREIYYPRTTALGFQNNGYANVGNYKSRDFVFESYLRFNRSIGKDRIDFIMGTSFQSNLRKSYSFRASGFPNDILKTDAIQFATSSYVPSTTKIERTLRSYYTRLNYNHLGRYILTLTGRMDGSSVFAENNKWGIFPSGAFSWRISEEPFFPKNGAVSNLKVRTSYGITGSQAIAPLGSLAQIGSANYVLDDNLVSGVANSTVGNNDLKWESTEQVNLGLDLGMLENKVRLTVDIYKKTTRDLLQTLEVPRSTGFTAILTNMGSIGNKGIDIDLSADILNKKVSWNTGFNVSLNRSKVLDLGVNDVIYGLGSSLAPVFFRSTPLTIVEVGQPFPMYYGYKAERLIQESDFDENGNPTFAMYNGEKRPGQWLYEDYHKDGIINALDRQVIGNPNPKVVLGFNNEINYKKLTLSFFIQSVLGNDIMNLSKAYLSTGMVNLNKYADWYENHWTPENPTNDINYTGIGTIQTNLVPGNYYIEDGSYVRLKTATISYQIPNPFHFVKNITLSLTGNNLITLTKYKGLDPEVGIFENNLLPSVDMGSYPRASSFYFSLKFNL